MCSSFSTVLSTCAQISLQTNNIIAHSTFIKVVMACKITPCSAVVNFILALCSREVADLETSTKQTHGTIGSAGIAIFSLIYVKGSV